MPKSELLAHDAGNVFSFEFIPGAPIGLEWWHHQMTKAIQGKLWFELMEGIGWTKEGLWNEKSYDDQSGLGFKTVELAKPAH